MVLAVKPQTIEDAIEATRASVEPVTVVLSVVAGVPLERFLPRLRPAIALRARDAQHAVADRARHYGV